jgi:hypothetical protein
MKRSYFFILLVVLAILLLGGYYFKRKYYDSRHRLQIAVQEVKQLSDSNKLRDGDIIFQTSLSKQSKAIQIATHSQYSHCGIIYKIDTAYMVFEAVQPVKFTPLDKWIVRGEGDHYVIKRLNNAEQVLTPQTLAKMKKLGEQFKGKNYDLYFDWSDDRIYCSELIWKIYKRATGLSVGKLQLLKDFDLSNEAVKEKLKERYGDKIPLNDTVISPVSIFNSDLLKTVKSN